jgi:hypothetical protein
VRLRRREITALPEEVALGREWLEREVAPSSDRAAILSAAIAAAYTVDPPMTLLELTCLANFLDLLRRPRGRVEGRWIELRVLLEIDPEAER